jgi:two-component system sensor histidine kinase KdpD
MDDLPFGAVPQPGERILVLVSGNPMSGALVRAGRRLADLTHAPWTVIHVERPDRLAVDPASGRRVSEALKLAEQLGAATAVLAGDDPPGAVLAYAGRNNVTQIVMGAPKRSRRRLLAGPSLAHLLMRRSGAAALHVISAGAAEPEAPIPEAPAPVRRRPLQWAAYLGALGLVVAANLLAAVMGRFTTGADLAMIFLAGVLVSGVAFGLRPAIAASALAFLTYNYFFLSPYFSLAIARPGDVLTFGIFLAVAGVTGWLTGRVRDQARLSAQRASAVSALLAASRRLSAAASREETAQALAEQASAASSGRAVVLTPVAGELAQAAGAPAAALLTADALAAARGAWEKGEAAGADAPPPAGWTFWPLVGLRGRVGVAGVEFARQAGPDDERLVAALLDQGAVALERAELADAENEALRRSDRLRAALLNAISHDLRPPLAAVTDSACALIDHGDSLEGEVRSDLLLSIREEAERLNRYVGDLLDMSRLEGGALRIRSEWTDVRHVADAAIGRVSRRLGQRRLVRDFSRELTSVRADPVLLEQAIINLLDNAIAYSPDGSGVEVAAYEDHGHVVIAIEDEGPGIPPADVERAFETFRQPDALSRGDRRGGSSLGLSIAKGFVEAMGGRIAVASPILHGRGARALISLAKATPTHQALL